MIISDLNYLEVASKSASLVRGGLVNVGDIFEDIDVDVDQDADAEAFADAVDGDANADATAANQAEVNIG